MIQTRQRYCQLVAACMWHRLRFVTFFDGARIEARVFHVGQDSSKDTISILAFENEELVRSIRVEELHRDRLEPK